MSARPVLISRAAEREIRQATLWYRKEGGSVLALRWADAVETALQHIGRNPGAGSPRYAVALNLSDLRFWPITGFPFLILYLESESDVEVLRVLHTQRDMPKWLSPGSP